MSPEAQRRGAGAVVLCALLVVLLLAAPGALWAQCEISPPTIDTTLATPGLSWNAVIDHCHAYVADDFAGGVQVIDICAPTGPVIVGTAVTSGGALGLDVDGGFLFVTLGGSGLEVFDVSNPSVPVQVGQTDIPNFAMDVTVAGGFAFVANKETSSPDFGLSLDGGVQVVDVRNPAAPVVRTKVEPGAIPPLRGGGNPGVALGVDVAGDYLYVADGPAGLVVFQITHELVTAVISLTVLDAQIGIVQNVATSNPQGVASGLPNAVLPTPGIARDVKVLGNFAFVADGTTGMESTSGLRVIDITNPLIPVLAAAVNTPGDARGISILGNNLYLADTEGGLHVFDITNPTAPVLVDTVNAPIGVAMGVATSGDKAVIADLTGSAHVAQIFNLDPATAGIVGTQATGNTAHAVDLVGNLAFVANDLEGPLGGPPPGGIQIVDVTDPTVPVLRGTLATSERAVDVVVDGHLAFVADWQPIGSATGGLEIFDISNPDLPVALSSITTPGDATSVAVAGEFAYIADGFAGVRFIDVSNPAAPFGFQFVETPDFTSGITVDGSRLYVANGFLGLLTMDISNPVAPQILSFVTLPGFASRVAIAAGHAFVAAGEAGLQVLDVRNPAAPVLLDTATIPVAPGGFASDVTISGTRALVGCGDGGVQIVNITDPAAPVLERTIDTPGFAGGVSVNGDIITVADGASGLQVLQFCGAPPPPPPSIAWVLPPPATIAGGSPFTVGWETLNFTGAVTENQAQMLDTTGAVLSQSPPNSINGVQFSPFTPPAVLTTTTVRMRARALDGGVEILSPTLDVTVTPPPGTPQISWTTPPPASVASGAQFTVTWTLTDFTAVSENQAFIDRGNANGVETISPVQAATNGAHSFTFTAPTVLAPTTVPVVARALDGATEVLSQVLNMTINPAPASISWVLEPPAAALGGDAVPVTWTLSNFLGPITANQAHFGVVSVLGSSDVKAPANGNHSHTFTAPNIGTFDSPTTFTYAIRALDNAVQVLSPFRQTVVTAGPLAPTVTWITPPPAMAVGGSQFDVTWQVSNFVSFTNDPLTEFNAVAWGVTRVLATTPNELLQNGVFAATVNVPLTSADVTVQYTAFAQNAIEFAFAPLTPVLITAP